MMPTSLFDPIDNYCERTAVGLFNEPLNAMTNAAFLYAAWELYKLYKKTGSKDREMETLISCISVVGLGSLAFHTFANYFAMMADVIPIVMFVCYYLWVAFQRLIGFDKLKAFAGVAAFLVLGAKAGSVPAAYSFNGSVSYFPCLIALIAMSAILRHRKHPSAPLLLLATGCFIASIFLRSVDQAVCPYFPVGTHFLWHSLNGFVLFLLGKSVLRKSA